MENITNTPSSGNVFQDLDLPEADKKLTLSALCVKFQQKMNESNLDYDKVKQLTGMNQSSIDNILRGRFGELDEVVVRNALEKIS